MSKLRTFEWIEFSFIQVYQNYDAFFADFFIWAVQKYVYLVDLVKSFPTNIYLQKLASMQPRTSLSKFGENEYIIQSNP